MPDRGVYCAGGSSNSGGLLNNVRTLLWVPINQRAFKRVSLDVFGHLLDLDLEFHLHRKTGKCCGSWLVASPPCRAAAVQLPH